MSFHPVLAMVFAIHMRMGLRNVLGSILTILKLTIATWPCCSYGKENGWRAIRFPLGRVDPETFLSLLVSTLHPRQWRVVGLSTSSTTEDYYMLESHRCCTSGHHPVPPRAPRPSSV